MVSVESPASRRGRINKRRGYDSEAAAARDLAPFGFERVPLSGADENNPGDLIRKGSLLDGKVLHLLENKRRTDAWLTFETWLPPAQFLRLDPGGRRRPWYAIPEEVFFQLLEEAGYGGRSS